MKKTQQNVLFAILLAVALFIVILQFQTVSSTNYPSYSSFYGVRQVESIQKNGFPTIFDDLSYQGRVDVTQILFYYLSSFFTLFIPVLLFFKYASIFIWALIVFLIYYVSNQLFANKMIIWLITFFTALSPILFTANLNTFEPTALFAVFFLLILNSFFSIKEENSLTFVVLILLSTFVSSLSLIFVVGFLIYVILIKISSKKLSGFELELILFSGVFITWLHFILYRKLFLEHGVSLFQASIPTELLLGSFYGLSVPMAIAIAGMLPLLLGLYGTYYVLFQEVNKKHLLLVSFLFSFIIALWAGFISFTQGFLFITLLLLLLSGVTLKQFNGYLNKTVLQKLKPLFVILALVLVIVNFIPVLGYSSFIQTQSPTKDEMQTMKFIEQNTAKESTVLSTIQEGHLISSQGKRKNFFDTNFIFAPQANQRYQDAKNMFLSKSETAVVGQMDYYGIDYVYISPQTQKTYPTTTSVFENGDCFNLIFETNTTKLFEETCNK
ncbi:hypothetical protein JXA48_00010 [Candidatus Woesearchaeota archaeon]|nr:hypothetical protein [Candidatus Woesearchaeota archaeon]